MQSLQYPFATQDWSLGTGRALTLQASQVSAIEALGGSFAIESAPGEGTTLAVTLEAKGGSPTAEIRLDMQRTMQKHAAVFRDSALLSEGVDLMRKVNLEQPMLDVEAAATEFPDLCLDHDLVTVGRRNQETGAQVDHRAADGAVMCQQLHLLHAEGRGEQCPGAGVEIGEVARKEDDAGRIAVAPFDGDLVSVGKRHGVKSPQVYR